jgi:hypothetical protein
MSNGLVELLFLAAFWVPPLTIGAGALLLIMPERSKRQHTIGHHAVPVRH